MNEEQVVVLNADDQAVTLKALKDLNFATQQLYQWLKEGSLSKDMSQKLPSLIEIHFSTIAEKLDYASYLAEEKEKRYVEIRNANIRIQELEEQLGSAKPLDGLQEQLKFLHDQVNAWWSDKGFNHISEYQFSPYGGYHLQFHFMLESRRYSFLSDTPETDRIETKQHVENLRQMGFEFLSDKNGKNQVLDTDNNRKLLLKFLKDRFPSLKIHGFKNWSTDKEGVYILRHIEATIYDLQEIVNNPSQTV